MSAAAGSTGRPDDSGIVYSGSGGPIARCGSSLVRLRRACAGIEAPASWTEMVSSGDVVMALFGAPVAHEVDPERAVRIALAIRDTLAADGGLHAGSLS